MPRRAPFIWRTYDLAVRAQVRIQGDERTWVFPAPGPVDRLVYRASDHGLPNFSSHPQSFWASERSHGVDEFTPSPLQDCHGDRRMMLCRSVC